MRLSELLNISELNLLIESRHIIVRRHPSLPLAILNYSNECMLSQFWPEAVQHCRGLIVETFNDSKDVLPESPIISRPFHKFFNLNQLNVPETLESNLPQVEPTVTEKMDGWFGILWKYEVHGGPTHYGIASRGSFESPGAVYATGKLPKLIKYGAIDEFPKGYTPIFEIICKDTKIVVDYPFEGLVLLGLVNNETGEELPYEELQAVWSKIAGYAADNRPWIRLVKAHRMSIDEVKSYDTVVVDGIPQPRKNVEGLVLSYPRPGTWPIKVKVKLDDYKRLHKLITGVTPQQIWGALHDPLAPWLGSNVPDHFRSWAIKWRDELYADFQKRLSDVMSLARAAGVHLKDAGRDRNNRAEVMEILNHTCPNEATIAMALLSGRIYEAHHAIWDRIRPVGRQLDVFYREGQGE